MGRKSTARTKTRNVPKHLKSNDPWRFICPNCGAHRGSIRYYNLEDYYFCYSCNTKFDELEDKKE